METIKNGVAAFWFSIWLVFIHEWSTRPQHMAAVLAKADWVIHHAGYGLASQALLAGVPLLMLPNHLEQTMFAVRVGEIKAGKVLPNDARLIGAALRQTLADADYAEWARRFAEQHASYSVSATLDRLVALCLTKIVAVP